MSGQAKLAIGGAVCVGTVVAIAYVQGQRFAESAAAGDFQSADRAALISFLIRDAAVAAFLVAVILAILYLFLLPPTGEGPGSLPGDSWPGYPLASGQPLRAPEYHAREKPYPHGRSAPVEPEVGDPS